MPYIGGVWYSDRELPDYSVTDEQAEDQGMAVWKQLMTLPSDILAGYLESLSRGENVVPITGLAQQALVNYPGNAEDPTFSYTGNKGAGYYPGQNTSAGRTIIDVISDMGQLNKLQPIQNGDVGIGAVNGQTVSNQWEQPTHDYIPPGGNNNVNKGGGSGTGSKQLNTNANGLSYDFLLDREKLRELINNATSGVQGLSPMQYGGNISPFQFSGNANPTVGNTKNLINAMVKRYRGL